jgi:integrase
MRATPFIYEQAEVDTLLAACGSVFADVRIASTMRTIIGLLAATGIRIGEALRLVPADIDSAQSVMLVRAGKSATDRLIPLDVSSLAALADHQQLPQRLAAHPMADGPIFVTKTGAGYRVNKIDEFYLRLTNAAGIKPRGRARPTLHSLRHTFATRHMMAAYQSGADPQNTLARLSTWLGHTSPAHTYWYLSATPELMALAADRLQRAHTPGERA